MSTTVVEQDVEVTQRLLTVADLAVMPDELPSGPVEYELHDGRLIIMAPPGELHGAYESNVVTQLKVQGEFKGHGKARTNVGIIMRRDPDRVYVPDVLFIASHSLRGLRKSREDYMETAPDLVVEVRSKNDSMRGLRRKADEYLRIGVQVVWILDPRSKTISICTKDAAPIELAENAVLTAEGIIPGFNVAVRDLFRD